MRPSPLSVVVVVAAASAPAVAQPAGQQAEQLFQQGRELFAAGKIAEACTAFDSSEKLDPAPSTLLALAVCREKNGQLATAWRLYGEVDRSTRHNADTTGKQLGQAAAADAAKVEPRLSKLTVRVPAERRVPGLEIRRGDTPIAPADWDQPQPIDGGTYQITASLPGGAPWSTTVTLRTEGDSETIEIPALAAPLTSPQPKPPIGPAHMTERPEPAVSAIVEPPAAHRSRALALGVGIGGVVLGGAALGAELWSSHTYDQSKREPDDTKQRDLWHSANDQRYVAEGLAIGGVAALAVGAVLYVHAGHRNTERVSVAPVLAPNAAGVALGGSY